MTNDIKKAIAKTLLITQLFCPLNIKYVNNQYEQYKDYSQQNITKINNFIIEKINPFDNKNIFFEPELLMYENRDEAIEELMKAVDLNFKLSKNIKNSTTYITDFLRDNPNIDLKNLYNLFGKLEVKYSEKLSDLTLMETIKIYTKNDTTSSGLNAPEDATIYVNENIMKDEYFLRSFFHELVHLSGSFEVFDGKQFIGSGLTEGMTSFIEEEYCSNLNAPESYFFFRTCTKMLAEIVGSDILLQCFSERDLSKLNNELRKKKVLEDDFVNLVVNMDYCLKTNNKTYYEKVIEFFDFYGFLIKDNINKTIYERYLETIKEYVYNSAIYKDVCKVYYNSKEKKENPTPYFCQRYLSKDLSMLPFEYEIISSDEEYTYLRVFITDDYVNLMKGISLEHFKTFD